MTPEFETKISEILEYLVTMSDVFEHDARDLGHQVLTHLSRINSTLSAIDRNLTLLEMKE